MECRDALLQQLFDFYPAQAQTKTLLFQLDQLNTRLSLSTSSLVSNATDVFASMFLLDDSVNGVSDWDLRKRVSMQLHASSLPYQNLHVELHFELPKNIQVGVGGIDRAG